jgi:hypothetical protein
VPLGGLVMSIIISTAPAQILKIERCYNMNNNFINKNKLNDDVRPSRPSIFTELERVKEQVEFSCFARFVETPSGKRLTEIEGIYNELCMIIAEVNILNPDKEIRIGGVDQPCYIVQEVYAKIHNTHVEFVVKNFKNVTSQVFNKKAYLRTALYNSVFEVESDAVNNIVKDMPGFFDRS